MRTVRVPSRDAGLAARLRRLLNGSLDLGAGALAQALEPGATGPADVLLLDFASIRVDPDGLAATIVGPRPFLVALLAPMS